MLNWTTIQNNDLIIQASNSMMRDCWNEVISQNYVWFTKCSHSYTERSFLWGKWPNIRHFHITKPNNEVRLGIRTKMNGNVTNHLSHEKRGIQARKTHTSTSKENTQEKFSFRLLSWTVLPLMVSHIPSLSITTKKVRDRKEEKKRHQKWKVMCSKESKDRTVQLAQAPHRTIRHSRTHFD